MPDTPMTSGTNPKSAPSAPEQRREAPEPGIRRGRTCSTSRRGRRRATRTTGQTTDPLVLRWNTGASSTAARLGLASSFADLRPHVRREDPLAQPDARRRHLHQLVVVDELDRLLEAELARRNRGGSLRRPIDARMLVCFFSLVTLTSMSLGREFSPMIMPS